jgi:hypothetical protein
LLAGQNPTREFSHKHKEFGCFYWNFLVSPMIRLGTRVFRKDELPREAAYSSTKNLLMIGDPYFLLIRFN